MNRHITSALGAATLLAVALGGGRADAQSVKSRILKSLEVREREGGYELQVDFSNPIRYLRHSPQRRGSVIEIQLSRVAVSRIDRSQSFGREALRLPSGSPIPLRDVVYDGRVDGSPTLEVQFTRAVDFEVRQGKNFRSIRIFVAGDPKAGRGRAVERAHAYAVQLWAADLSEALPEIEASQAFDGHRLYTTRFKKGGRVWQRLRLGFFRREPDALAAAARVRTIFPEAWVVPVTRSEWIASSRTEVPAPLAGRARERSPVPEAQPVRPAAGSVADWMAKGRRAMTAGDLDAAVRIYTKVLTLPESDQTPAAKEFLGLARQRKGQLAHAKAEYQEYLAMYPDGEGAARVRQRLDALVTARAEPAEERKPRAGGFRDADVWGSVFTSYARAESITGPSGSALLASTGSMDVNVTGRIRSDRFEVRPEFAGSESLEFLGPDVQDDTDVTTLQIGLRDRDLGLSGILGRQSRSDGGVLGRFDGLHLDYELHKQWGISANFGFPINTLNTDDVQFDKYFYGVSLEATALADVFDLQLFGIGQRVDGVTDRLAVGAELRYAQEGRYLAIFSDYDVHFDSLNAATLVGNWSLTERTDLNFFFNYLNSPILTTENALQGQTARSIEALRLVFTNPQIKALAEDRTARSITATLGASHTLREHLEISGDVTLTRLGGTPASGGVLATESTGYEYSYFIQLLGSDVLMAGDVGILGLRFFDGDGTDTYTVTLNGRYPLFGGLRANPRARFDYRRIRGAADTLRVRPSIRLDYAVGNFTFDAESGLEWNEAIGASGAGDDLGYTVNVGVRADF